MVTWISLSILYWANNGQFSSVVKKGEITFADNERTSRPKPIDSDEDLIRNKLAPQFLGNFNKPTPA